MAPIHSQYYYATPSGWTEGGCVGEGDYHVWVANKDGEVVYDPMFHEYNAICNFRGLDIDAPVYQIWPNQKKWYKEKVKKYVGYLDSQMIRRKYKNPQPLECPTNAYSWLQFNKGKGYRLVVGSMGWRFVGECRAHWEFG